MKIAFLHTFHGFTGQSKIYLLVVLDVVVTSNLLFGSSDTKLTVKSNFEFKIFASNDLLGLQKFPNFLQFIILIFWQVFKALITLHSLTTLFSYKICISIFSIGLSI